MYLDFLGNVCVPLFMKIISTHIVVVTNYHDIWGIVTLRIFFRKTLLIWHSSWLWQRDVVQRALLNVENVNTAFASHVEVGIGLQSHLCM